MRVAVHLPQYGKAAGPESVRDAARAAERLGFSDVWVSDHVVFPLEGRMHEGASPYLMDPILTLTWAAAATERIGIGGSLIAPHFNAVWLAHALGTLDTLSAGRLTLALGVGWLDSEFAALGTPFSDRGRKTDETIDVLRACWGPDPVTFKGPSYAFGPLKMLPKPVHDVPIWVAGSSDVTLARVAARGDGWHAIKLGPEEAADASARLRRAGGTKRPTFSLRLNPPQGWDPATMEADEIRRQHEQFAAAGLDHVVAAPSQRELPAWIESMAQLAEILELPAAR
jgi:probable F420-dependent oxidoreductase